MQDRHRIFVMLAKKYESKITICKEGGEPVNAKSVVRLLAEGIGQGNKSGTCKNINGALGELDLRI
mgnify:CR=1 FL=1